VGSMRVQDEAQRGPSWAQESPKSDPRATQERQEGEQMRLGRGQSRNKGPMVAQNDQNASFLLECNFRWFYKGFRGIRGPPGAKRGPREVRADSKTAARGLRRATIRVSVVKAGELFRYSEKK
jgi:hypothetical protein